jgi:hypothetical protein
VLQFSLKNTSEVEVEAELAGWLENGVCRHAEGVAISPGKEKSKKWRNTPAPRDNSLLRIL